MKQLRYVYYNKITGWINYEHVRKGYVLSLRRLDPYTYRATYTQTVALSDSSRSTRLCSKMDSPNCGGGDSQESLFVTHLRTTTRTRTQRQPAIY